MLSICIRTQTAITVLHEFSSGNVLQLVNFFFPVGVWKGLFGEFGQGLFIRLLPNKEPLARLSLKQAVRASLADIKMNAKPEK